MGHQGDADVFEGIAGHRRIRLLLASQMARGRLSHAYLLTGETGLGKTEVARRMAAAVLPEAALRRHPDYWEDDRRRSISIDEVRLLPDRQPEFHQQSLQAFLSLKPALGSRRVALITNVGRLKDEVQGILLKTLEEPHPGRVILLTSPNASPFVVLPTIVSRCQRLAFQPVADEEIESLLETEGLAREHAADLARLARGRPGWALQAARDPALLERHRHWAARLGEVLAGDRSVALRLAAELDQAGSAWRTTDRTEEDPILVAIASWQLELRRRMMGGSDRGRWARLIERSFDTLGHHEQNVSPRLALECFLLASRAA
ncbi:MAG: ATP-binding protein [Candidatus Dormibacteraceae bacterium]